MAKTAKPREGQIYVARESFSTTLDGVPISGVAGQTRVRAGHRLLEQCGQFFEPLVVHYEVEQATAAPGEKRGRSKSAKPKTAARATTEPKAKTERTPQSKQEAKTTEEHTGA